MKRRRGAFTLLELLVVVAILAILAGGMLLAYNGLEDKQSHGVVGNNLAGVDRAVRQYATLNGGAYPNNLDSLIHDAGGTPALLDRLHEEALDKLTTGALTANEAAQLTNLYQTAVLVRDIDAAYDNDGDFSNDALESAVNNMFDLPALGGVGTARSLATGGQVALLNPASAEAVETLLKLRLDPTTYTKAIVVGLSNGSTIAQEGVQGGMSSVPFQHVPAGRYGRLFLVFAVDDNNADAEAKARFVGVIDTHGHPKDDALKDFRGE